MSLNALVQDVSAPEGFVANVKVDRAATGVGIGALVLAGIGVLWNLRSTLRSMDDNPGVSFLRIFFSTHGTNDAATVLLNLTVWGPVVLIPIAIGFFVYSAITSKSHKEELFRTFQSRGYVAIAEPSGMTFQADRKSEVKTVELLTHPSLTAQQNADLARDVLTRVLSGGEASKEAASLAARNAGVQGRPVPLAQVLPGFPEGPLLTLGDEKRRGCVVIMPDPAKPKASPQIYNIK